MPFLSTSPEQSCAHMMSALQAALPHFKQIEWYERTGSTNADLLTKARTSELRMARPWLLGAQLQDEGRGRSGRRWQNRAGANLMFSCAFDAFLPAQQLPALSPLAGVATCEALRNFLRPEHQHRLTMKWPNDVEWDFSKLGGILVEVTRAGTSRLVADHYVVIIGLGLNLDDARSLSRSLSRRIADWSEIAEQDDRAASVPHTDLAAHIAQAWYTALNEVIGRGFDGFPARHAAVDGLAGQHINIVDGPRVVQSGIACGVNRLGQLLVRSAEGESAVSVGEVSVRPLVRTE